MDVRKRSRVGCLDTSESQCQDSRLRHVTGTPITPLLDKIKIISPLPSDDHNVVVSAPDRVDRPSIDILRPNRTRQLQKSNIFLATVHLSFLNHKIVGKQLLQIADR
jgi:hypothetical protein